MQKGINALILVFTYVMYGGTMMASPATTSFLEPGFNESLSEWEGKSTPIPSNGLQKVVIDAGHGGKDPGGMGKNSQEKHIALNIARLLAIGIRTNYPGVEVIMTRSDDTFVPLYERANIANKAGADLFISIHANIMPGGTSTYGTETFVMGQHVAEQNLRVAKRENAAILLESGDVTTNYGYDPNSPEGHIMMTMQQHAFLERSILFAEAVEQRFEHAGRKSRGVKQAGFVVLKATTMPAVLVETGFMSNPDEEAFLLSDAGQQKLATSLLNAFGDYYKLVTGDQNAPVVATPTPTAPQATSPAPARRRPTPASTPRAKQVVVATAPAPVPVPTRQSSQPTQEITIFDKQVALTPAGNFQWEAKGIGTPTLAAQAGPAVQEYQPVATPVPVRSAQPSVLNKEVMPPAANPANRVIPGRVYRPASIYQNAVFPQDSVRPFKFTDAQKKKDAGGVDLSKIDDSQLLYAVQIIASGKNLDLSRPPFSNLPYSISKIQEGNYNKYQIRQLRTARDAAAARQTARTQGFKDAMVVVYYQGRRLAAQSVNYLLKR